MRIIIIVDCYLPKVNAGTKLIYDLGVELSGRGNEVTILTPLETITGAFELEQVQLKTGQTMHVARVRTGQIKGASRMARACQEFLLSATMWRAAGPYLKAHPADLIIFYSPSIFFGTLVKRLKALWNCPAYLILRDIFPQWAVDAGLLKRNSLPWRFLRWKEQQQYLVADVIGVISPASLRYFATEFPQISAKQEVLHNWTATDEGELPRTDFRQLWGLQDKVVFVYGGNIGVAQDVDNLIRLAKNLEDEESICLILVGGGSESERIENVIRERNLRNIRIYPSLQPKAYLTMLSEFDVGLLSLDRRLTTHNVPGKLLGYLNCSLPVLASLNEGNDLFSILAEYRAGISLLNGDDEGLRSAALQLAANRELRERMGRGGRRLLEEKFSVGAAAEQILNSLEPETKRHSRWRVETPTRAMRS